MLSVSSDESEETEELSETVPGAETSAVPMKSKSPSVYSSLLIAVTLYPGVRFLNGSAVRIGVGCSFNFRILWKRYHTGKTFLFCVLQGIMCKIIITEIKYGTGIVDIIEVITG